MLRRKMLQLRLLGGIKERIRGVSLKRRVCDDSSSAATQGTAETQGYAPLPTNRTAHPAIYSIEPKEEVENESKPQRRTLNEPDPFTPPIASSQKLTHTEVGLPPKPNTHPKRTLSTEPAQTLPEVNCTGLDGSEWGDDTTDQKAQNKAQEEDNTEYFKHHKASSLSEIEFADTRKPITQATDSITSEEGVIVFKEEQKDSAEEALLRAYEIWKWNKIRGDPNSPHGRVLRELRGEFW